MAGARLHRLARELELLRTDPPPGVAAWPVDEADISRFHASIQGPEGTPYEDGVFCLELELSERYPFEPPMVRFVTPVFHPNIDERGRICLDTLKAQPQGSWSPSLNLPALLTTIRLLLAHPNAEDGLVPEATEVYRRDPQAFERLARQHTARHATAPAAAVVRDGGGGEGDGIKMQVLTSQEEDNGDEMKVAAPSSEAEAEVEAIGVPPNSNLNPAATAALEGQGAGGGGDMEEEPEEDAEEEGDEDPRRWDSDVSVCGEDGVSCSAGSSSSSSALGEEEGGGDEMRVGAVAWGDGGEEEPKCDSGGGKARGGFTVGGHAMEPEMFVVSAEGLPPTKRGRRR